MKQAVEQENLGVDANGEATIGVTHEGESTNAALGGGLPGSSEEAERCPWSQAGRPSESNPRRVNRQQEEPAVLTKVGSSSSMARAGSIERFKSGCVRVSG
jgi:hypothetical protein